MALNAHENDGFEHIWGGMALKACGSECLWEEWL